MYRWDIAYKPHQGAFTKYIETVHAGNYEMAMMKFYGKVGDNVCEVIQVERSL